MRVLLVPGPGRSLSALLASLSSLSSLSLLSVLLSLLSLSVVVVVCSPIHPLGPGGVTLFNSTALRAALRAHPLASSPQAQSGLWSSARSSTASPAAS